MQVNLPVSSSLGSGAQPTTIREAAQQFESIFVGQLMDAMRRTSPKGGALTPGGGEEMFRQMFDQEIAQRISLRGGVGIGELLYKQLAPENAGNKWEAPHPLEKVHALKSGGGEGAILHRQPLGEGAQQRSKLESPGQGEKIHASR